MQALWNSISAVVVMAAAIWGLGTGAHTESVERIGLRGHTQSLYLSGPRGGTPVIVSSGDGGWIHLAPHVTQLLAARGFFVVGLNVRAYLSSGTTLRPADEADDFRTLIRFATADSGKKAILIGVSEGAGLSVLAASDGGIKPIIAGVIGLGLPDINELAWRWQDSMIYLTHGVPNEPTFSARAIIGKMTPVPLAAIHSTHDEFVPLSEIHTLMQAAGEPKKLWVVEAVNHRFANNIPEFDRVLLEAVTWINQHAAH